MQRWGKEEKAFLFCDCHSNSTIASVFAGPHGHSLGVDFLCDPALYWRWWLRVTWGYTEDSVLVRPEIKHFTLK